MVDGPTFDRIGVVPSAMMISGNWDREFLLTLNSLVGSDGLLYLWELANNSHSYDLRYSLLWSPYGSPTIAENGVAECWPDSLQSV